MEPLRTPFAPPPLTAASQHAHTVAGSSNCGTGCHRRCCALPAPPRTDPSHKHVGYGRLLEGHPRPWRREAHFYMPCAFHSPALAAGTAARMRQRWRAQGAGRVCCVPFKLLAARAGLVGGFLVCDCLSDNLLRCSSTNSRTAPSCHADARHQPRHVTRSLPLAASTCEVRLAVLSGVCHELHGRYGCPLRVNCPHAAVHCTCNSRTSRSWACLLGELPAWRACAAVHLRAHRASRVLLSAPQWIDEGALCREAGRIKTIAKKSYGAVPLPRGGLPTRSTPPAPHSAPTCQVEAWASPYSASWTSSMMRGSATHSALTGTMAWGRCAGRLALVYPATMSTGAHFAAPLPRLARRYGRMGAARRAAMHCPCFGVRRKSATCAPACPSPLPRPSSPVETRRRSRRPPLTVRQCRWEAAGRKRTDTALPPPRSH